MGFFSKKAKHFKFHCKRTFETVTCFGPYEQLTPDYADVKERFDKNSWKVYRNRCRKYCDYFSAFTNYAFRQNSDKNGNDNIGSKKIEDYI